MTISAEILSVLETAPLFHGVKLFEPLLQHLAHAQVQALGKGETLLSPEQPNDHVYMVISGRLSIQPGPAPETEAIAMLGSGECAGEMSVLGDNRVSAWVIAATDCRLLAIDQVALWGLIDSSHEVAHNMLRILAERIHGSNQMVTRSLEKHYGYSAQNMVDELTGLYNHNWMENKFSHLLHRKQASSEACCLIVLEVDAFDEIGKNYGELGRDQMLRTVAQCMLTSLRPDDLAGRSRGAQFAIFLSNTHFPEEGQAAAEHLRRAVENTPVVLPSGDALPSTSISLGVALSHPGDLLDDLLDRAGRALQQAQQAGGNRSVTIDQR